MSRPDVQALFDRIAPVYDAMNERISYGRQRVWKRRLVRDAAAAGGRALDLCCGTGDIALLLAASGRFSELEALDFSSGMLAIAGRRLAGLPVTLHNADASRPLPFLNGRFDAVTLSFGLRNLAGPAAVLPEIRRILAAGGRLYLLDACRPEGVPARLAHWVQYRIFFPLMTRKRRADYDWLRRSSEGFWSPAELREAAAAAGFQCIKARRYALGLVLYLVLEASKGEEAVP
ncbi:MAG: class I SAM-dependent methyltransferase [Clostridia bacterium]|nr:class I SAM-dependent methyltransferase [Clostridia bacterium]